MTLLTVNETINEIVEEFDYFDEWEERYFYLIEMGKNLEKMDESLKIDDNKLRGCQSTVFFHFIKNKDDTISFRASSDAAIVQGLIALLSRIYNNRLPKDILSVSTDFLETIGLQEHLSITRKNGLASMIKSIESAARNSFTA